MRRKQAKIKPAKLRKPVIGKLKKALKRYVSPSVSERLNALNAALEWYEDAVRYVLSKPELLPDCDMQATVADAEQEVIYARNAKSSQEIEDSLCGAINSFEECCERLNPPLLLNYQSLLVGKKEKFDHRSEALQSRYKKLLETVEQALGIPFKVRGGYGEDVTHEVCNDYFRLLPLEHLSVELRSGVKRKLNPALKTYFYNKQGIVELQKSVRRDGLVAALLNELRVLGRAAAIDSMNVVNPDLLLAIWEQGMISLEQFVREAKAPYKLTRQTRLAKQKGESE